MTILDLGFRIWKDGFWLGFRIWNHDFGFQFPEFGSGKINISVTKSNGGSLSFINPLQLHYSINAKSVPNWHDKQTDIPKTKIPISSKTSIKLTISNHHNFRIKQCKILLTPQRACGVFRRASSTARLSSRFLIFSPQAVSQILTD